MSPENQAKVRDVAERTLWSFAEGLLAALILLPAFDLSALKAAALGGLTAAAAYLKSSFATLFGGTVSPASTAPAPAQPADPAPWEPEPMPGPVFEPAPAPQQAQVASGGILVTMTVLPAPIERQS